MSILSYDEIFRTLLIALQVGCAIFIGYGLAIFRYQFVLEAMMEDWRVKRMCLNVLKGAEYGRDLPGHNDPESDT